jgi:hypothetical protein
LSINDHSVCKVYRRLNGYLCANAAGSWVAAGNQMTSYQPDHLRRVMEPGSILILAREDDQITSADLAYVLPHPAGDDDLYVHELDLPRIPSPRYE